MHPSDLPDITLKVIWPATDVHIAKYEVQERVMVNETPEVFEKVVVPYIESFDPSRLEWYVLVDQILRVLAEAGGGGKREKGTGWGGYGRRLAIHYAS